MRQWFRSILDARCLRAASVVEHAISPCRAVIADGVGCAAGGGEGRGCPGQTLHAWLARMGGLRGWMGWWTGHDRPRVCPHRCRGGGERRSGFVSAAPDRSRTPRRCLSCQAGRPAALAVGGVSGAARGGMVEPAGKDKRSRKWKAGSAVRPWSRGLDVVGGFPLADGRAAMPGLIREQQDDSRRVCGAASEITEGPGRSKATRGEMLQDASLGSMLDERRQHHRTGKKDDSSPTPTRIGPGVLQQLRGASSWASASSCGTALHG